MSEKIKLLCALAAGFWALLGMAHDAAGDSVEGAEPRKLVIEVSDGEPVFYSLKTGQKVADPASRDWDIGFERPRLIYTNSGETAAALGSGGLGGVWHTEKTDFAGATPADAVKNDSLYGPYTTDAIRWIEGAMLKPAASRRINCMTFTGYSNEANKDGKTRAAAFSASFSYNKRQFYSARGMPPVYTVTSRVYIIRHGDGRGESKFQALAYESRKNTDRYVIQCQTY